MRGVKGIVLVLMLVFVGFVPVCALAGGSRVTAKEQVDMNVQVMKNL